jgi:hypothetical protein
MKFSELMPFGSLANEPDHVGFEVVTAVIMKSLPAGM